MEDQAHYQIFQPQTREDLNPPLQEDHLNIILLTLQDTLGK